MSKMIRAPLIDFGRAWCAELSNSGNHEWLVSNGIGGYASGTVAGLLTRRYHGLLIAALNPPVGRTLLLTKIDETAFYNGESYTLFCNHWANGTVEPKGFHFMERFYLEGTTPVWRFAFSEAQLEKRIWMQPGTNTTFIRFDLTRALEPLNIDIKAIVNFRDHHGNTRKGDPTLAVEKVPNGLKITSDQSEIPFYLFSDNAQTQPESIWYEDYFLSLEAYRGLNPVDDNFAAGKFRATINPGESLTLVSTLDSGASVDGYSAYAERQAYEKEILEQSNQESAPGWIQQVVLAANQFIVTRKIPDQTEGRSIIAGYHWFGDWGRDTMISLPGLTLTTGRENVARKILRTFAGFVDQGMLPNNFPEEGQPPAYNTVDATLWYFEAIRAYYAETTDKELLEELFPTLDEIIDWHLQGTRYNIGHDPEDGLIFAGEPGVQLTWMDAKVDDWVVTPRIGKPVEVNALWYNGLQCMAHFAEELNNPAERFFQAAEKTKSGFSRFWNQSAGYCFDVLDSPSGNDPSLRPNQLFAVSLPHSPLTAEQQKSVVDVCAQKLWTSHGLKSLAAGEPGYHGKYGGDRKERDGAYHQGTVWGWLVGPFISAHYRVYKNPELAMSYLMPLVKQLQSHGLGSLSEIFDGDPPFSARGCIAQAWTVAEVLRIWREIFQESK